MKMEKPTVEAVRFGSRDVIATSGQLGVMLGGFGNGTSGDWFVSNVKGATSGMKDKTTIIEYFNAASGAGFNESNYDDAGFSLDGQSSKTLYRLVNYLDADEDGASYNGWYIWYDDPIDDGYFWKQ